MVTLLASRFRIFQCPRGYDLMIPSPPGNFLTFGWLDPTGYICHIEIIHIDMDRNCGRVTISLENFDIEMTYEYSYVCSNWTRVSKRSKS